MARVWFVRRHGGQWVAPGGSAAFERPLSELIFPLDLGVHRLVTSERPDPAPGLAAEPPEALQRVFVEVGEADLDGMIFSGYRPGIYDSPYSPAEVARRLTPRARVARSAA
ncbi:MAG: hypothetical protein SF182_24795 [Deltaproteobacteria bacterium]|nr:hypothetical protein [Deltaproteobacteria bacterium]